MHQRILILLLASASCLFGQGLSLKNPGYVASLKPPVASGGSYTAPAVAFDGSTTLTTPANLTGAGGISSKKVTWSFWIKVSTAGTITICDQDGGDMNFQVTGSEGHFNINHFTTGNASGGCTFTSNGTGATSGSGWHWVGLSYDSGASICQLYVDNTAATFLSGPTFVDATLYWNDGVFAISKANSFTGSLSDFWVSAVDQIDFSQASNRQKFRSSGGAPVDLGATGATPTGSQPIIYLHGNASSFTNNVGSGGGFPASAGAVTTDSSGPP